jgi:hypothetical protein
MLQSHPLSPMISAEIQGFQASKKSKGLSRKLADALLDRKSRIPLGHLTKIQLTQWQEHCRPKSLN